MRIQKAERYYQYTDRKADISRLYVRRREGERGWWQIEGTYKVEIMNIPEYLKTKCQAVQSVWTAKGHESSR